MCAIDPVEPEYIDAVELGAKTVLFDGRLSLNFALFRYWYKDLQVFDVVNEVGRPPTSQLLNSPRADVLGAELEFEASPLPGLLIRGGGGWLDSEFLDFVVTKQIRPPARAGVSSVSATFDYSGNSLISAPDWNFSGLVEYELTLPKEWGALVPHFDFSWRSKVHHRPDDLDRLSQPAYWLLNARLAYRSPDQRLEIAGWVQNLANQEYLVDSFDLHRDPVHTCVLP